jgi:hypothetical protein
MINRWRRLAATLTISVVAIFLSTCPTLAAVRSIALYGQQAPGLPVGETFTDGFSSPTINNDSRVAFVAHTQVAGNPAHSGIWTDRSGTLQMFMVSGSPAPGASPNTYAPNIEAYINDTGRIAFEANLIGSSVTSLNNYGIWSDGSGSIAKVARTGDAAPGVPARTFSCSNPGTDFNGQQFCSVAPMDRPLFNDLGHAVIYSELYNNTQPPPATRPQEEGLWSDRTGTLQKVVTLGDSAPGTGGQFTIFSSEFLSQFAAFNSRDDIAFSASTNSNLSGAGVWISRGTIDGPVGQLDFVVGPNSSTNGVLPGITIRNATLAGFNDARQVGFLATLQGSGVTDSNDASLWLWSNGNLRLVAREGQPLGGTGYTPKPFFSFPSTAINGAGKFVLDANVSTDSSSKYGIFTADESGTSLIALGGQHAPGTPDSVLFDNFIGSTGNVAINGAGQVAFLGNLTGPGINSTNDQGLWATDRAGVLRLIAREKDTLEYSPGLFGIIATFSSNPRSGNEDGDKITFNDRGEVVFYAAGTNFTWGIFVSDVATVPEPAGTTLVAFAFFGTMLHSARLRRRSRAK